jgi:hypothetical protein
MSVGMAGCVAALVLIVWAWSQRSATRHPPRRPW